ALDHRPSRLAVLAERAFLAAMGGGCQAAVGALATPTGAGEELALEVLAASPDGHLLCRRRLVGTDPAALGTAGAQAPAAAGADLVVFGEESVDPFNPKTVRASAGAVLVVPVLCGPALEALAGLRAGGTRVLAAVARGGQPHTEVDLARPVALVLGNEAAGLDPAVAGACDEQVSVPMPGAVESLNLASAAAVLLFEAVRQRSNLPDVPRAGEGSKGPGGRW
ncbi:TrmH family RNA methyltransferase, partial [Aciditerrimonas ferrireducens]